MSEDGRARALRDHLHSVDAAHRASTRRLSSKLSEVQGNIDSRLRALTIAFDAYVELGDVREEMRMLPDWRATRSAVSEALENLMSAQTAQLIDTSKHDHWVAHAMNAVISLVEGWPVSDHEARANQQSDRAPLLVVLISLALGAGRALDGRLVALFDGVSTLDEDHLLLFRAAVAGLTTPSELQDLGARLAHQLDRPEEWMAFLGLSTQRANGLDTVTAFLDGVSPMRDGKQPWSIEGLEESLRTRTATLAQAGSEREAELLERAQVLRRRIEEPSGAAPRPFEPVAVFEAVRDALVHPEVPAPSRAILISLLHAPLRSALRAWLALPAPDPATAQVRARLALDATAFQAHNIEVTHDGGNREQIRRAKERIMAAEISGLDPSRRMGIGVGAAVLGFVLLLLGGGWQVLGVMFLVTAVSVAAWALVGMRNRNKLEQAKAAAVGQIDHDVRQTTDRLRERRRQDAADHAARRMEIERVLAERLSGGARDDDDALAQDRVLSSSEDAEDRTPGPDFTQA